MNGIQITSPTDDDWPWIIAQHAVTAWASLPPGLQNIVNIQTVQESLAEQVKKLHAEHSISNQVFIAHNDDKNSGYVWVGQVRSAFTGAMQAHIINLFVSEQFRGKGIGLHLMERSETWAREHHLLRIGLSVALQNSVAIGLYKQLGYKCEILRMSKSLENG